MRLAFLRKFYRFRYFETQQTLLNSFPKLCKLREVEERPPDDHTESLTGGGGGVGGVSIVFRQR